MKKRTRYLFLGLGFLVFALASPLVVLYVRGLSYDWETGSISPTGLLSVKTDPSGADIFLNGEKNTSTPASIRFLKPGDYTVTIKKEGYFDWVKTLNIKANSVVWASDELQSLYLIKKDPAPVIIASHVKDFFVGNKYALYLTDTQLQSIVTNTLTEEARTTIPTGCATITVSPDEQLVLLSCQQGHLLYTRPTLEKKPVQLAATVNYTFGPDNNLYSIENGVLTKTDTATGQRTSIAENVQAFGFEGIVIYVVKTMPAGQTTELATIGLYDQRQSQTLTENLPLFQTTQIYIARSKAIFLLGDSALYRVNEGLEPLVKDVKEIGFDAAGPSLSVNTGFELYDYDFITNKIRLVLRDGGSLHSPFAQPDIGYVLFLGDSKLQITEVDTRDRMNTYDLIRSPALGKYIPDPTHHLIYFLDGATFKFITYR